MPIIPVILSGGAGTRLWPASRDARPKQFLDLFGPLSTFQETLKRVADPALFERPIILTNRDHRFLVAEQTKEIGIAADIVLEPVRRDSGPAIAAGAHLAIQRAGPDAIVVVLAADHVIRDPAAFAAACANAAEAAARGLIVTFGMTPDRPETSYGYVKPGALLNGCALRALDAFVEKPDQSTAERYLADGYLWNSGNFLFGAATLLREYSDVDPQTVEAAGAAVANAVRDLDFIVLDEESFRRTTPQSIDYAVMERTKRAAVLPGDFGWSDVGSWDAVWALSPQDANGNVVAGPALMRDSKDSIVMSEKLTTAVIGVEGIAVIATEDAILVTRRTDAASLKALVGDLRKRLPNVTDCGAKVYRPWGMYQSLEAGDRHQVKRITVKPGGQLSLQKHHHRSEHWVVVRGTAKVVLGTSERVLYENESVYIPIGTVHRLTNPGKIDLELIEVQTGSYLGEDDIVRLEDVYNRSEEPESGPPASTRALATNRVT
ncbi:MAG TPA: mannose-1-phosphate guanylyltransferase/mannose-6-phosphate isomerase [Beijerinckiaceae bacterium]|nr:mannose-1-phosphate guanylyltransferase/mannose-6-phosphate isomerase [Beijerinckiaceae bacterium]